jgi:hypothetical protein
MSSVQSIPNTYNHLWLQGAGSHAGRYDKTQQDEGESWIEPEILRNERLLKEEKESKAVAEANKKPITS